MQSRNGSGLLSALVVLSGAPRDAEGPLKEQVAPAAAAEVPATAAIISPSAETNEDEDETPKERRARRMHWGRGIYVTYLYYKFGPKHNEALS